jgi:hypothetical protein
VRAPQRSSCQLCSRRAAAASSLSAASTAPPQWTSCWPAPATAGRPSSTTTKSTCTSGGTRAAPASELHAEIRQRGYPGSYSTVRDYLQPFRELGAAPPAAPAPPKTRDITRWLLSHSDSLDEDEKTRLKDARDRCPHVDALARRVTTFAEILAGRHGDRLDNWIAAVEAERPARPALLRPRHQARLRRVKNGLTLQWSSGKVEGNVNRLKVLKRQMYGHAGFDLLRHRVLLTT